MPQFVHLHTHSHYSLLDGLAKIDNLLAKTKEMGMNSIALTDHGNLYGAIEFYKKAKKIGIKPIIGIEGYLTLGSRFSKQANVDNERYHIILLAKNNIGWKNLMQISTLSYLEGFYYKPRIDKELLEKYHEGLICLSGCMSGEIPRLLEKKKIAEAENSAKWHQSIFGEDFYLEIQPHNNLSPLLSSLGKKLGIEIVGTEDIHYINKDDATAHEILLAVQTNSKLDDPDRLSLKKYDLSLASPEAMAEKFKDYPQATANTIIIAEKCNLEIELEKTKLPRFSVPENKNAFEYLQELVNQKINNRYPKITPEIKERLKMELDVIQKTGFSDYFLIVQDYINWAKLHGIVVGPGRGSSAGSIVAYVLGITNIDPLAYDLLFERFLNPDRIQVPDIDVDFTDTRRDEVLAYTREKYGENNVAQIITFGTMMGRAAVRDAGRAMGLAYSFCDQIAKLIPFTAPPMPLVKALENVPELKNLYETNEDAKKVLDAALKLEGTARHASVHACGVVISPEPLVNFTPLQHAPQDPNITITQFEMHSIEDLGLLKMDFLGLKNLTIIEQTLRLIKDFHNVDIDINNIPLNDKKTFELLQSAETTGIFQLESSGMRRYLKELRPSELEDIIAMVSLYRPGPIELIPSYIKRKFGKEEIVYLHPKLQPILSKTYGVGVYQEQMMRIARDLAGFTLAESDTLRKAIGKKIKKLLDEQKEKLINGMVKNGIPQNTAEAIWELFPPFARYGFNRSHAACYAMISYETAYLKAHYTVEFMASLLNISGTDIERINFLVSETKRLGIDVLPPDINASFENFTVDGKNIRFGLTAIKNVGANIVSIIINERSHSGPFIDLKNFLSRIHNRDLNKKSLESLIKCGAFDTFGIERGEALANIEELTKFNQAVKKAMESNQNNLFGTPVSFATLNLKPAEATSKTISLQWEKELLGIYVSDHPFKSYIADSKGQFKSIKEAILASTQTIIPRIYTIGGIVAAVQKIVTKKGSPMLFVTIEDTESSIEILVFSETLAKTEKVWEVGKPIIIRGRFSTRNGENKLICEEAKEIQ